MEVRFSADAPSKTNSLPGSSLTQNWPFGIQYNDALYVYIYIFMYTYKYREREMHNTYVCICLYPMPKWQKQIVAYALDRLCQMTTNVCWGRGGEQRSWITSHLMFLWLRYIKTYMDKYMHTCLVAPHTTHMPTFRYTIQ